MAVQQIIPQAYRREFTASGAGVVPASSLISAAPPLFPTQWQIGGVANFAISFVTGAVAAGHTLVGTNTGPINDNNFPQSISLQQNQHVVIVPSIYLNPTSAAPASPILWGTPTFGLTFGMNSNATAQPSPGAAITFNGPCTLANPGCTLSVYGYAPANVSSYIATFTLQIVLYGATY